ANLEGFADGRGRVVDLQRELDAVLGDLDRIRQANRVDVGREASCETRAAHEEQRILTGVLRDVQSDGALRVADEEVDVRSGESDNPLAVRLPRLLEEEVAAEALAEDVQQDVACADPQRAGGDVVRGGLAGHADVLRGARGVDLE